MLIQDWILCFLFIFSVVFLLLTCKLNIAKYTNLWRILYLLPAVICFFHCLLAGVEWCLSGIYIGALFISAGYFVTKETLRKNCSILAIALCIFTLPVCFLSNNYRTASYVADFEEGFALMKEHYSLSQHKQVDWNALYQEYLPLFEQAEKEQNENANISTWLRFCNEFYDCHTSYLPNGDSEAKLQAVSEQIVGNDYGLSLVLLSTGEYAAVSVEENSPASKAGIHTGTVITKWDGIDITELLPTAIERMKHCMIVGNVENQNFYAPLFVAGIGGDQIQVTFQNDKGAKETVCLETMGNYYQRLMDTYTCLTYKTPRENMSIVSLNEETIMLNINMMSYNSDTQESVNYSNMQSAIREQLIAYREQGVSNLIIDLRKNSGGSSMMAQAIVSLLADKEIFWAADGRYHQENAAYEILKNYTCGGENLWEDGEIVILVNSESNSAANHFMAGAQKLDHVTVMGISEPSNAAQGVTQFPLNYGILGFSMTLVLDETGEIWIDSDKSGQCRLLVDEKISLTKEALTKIFDKKEDYVLDYATAYFEGKP